MPLDEARVQELAKRLEQDFPVDPNDPAAELETAVIHQTAIYHYDRAKIRRGRFVLEVTDDCFGDGIGQIALALHSLGWLDGFKDHDRLILTGPSSALPNTVCATAGNWQLCRERAG